MNIKNVILAICSLLFFVVAADKFLMFMEPPCSLQDSISPTVWKIFGVMQLSAGFLIWLPKFRKPVALFFTGFMIFFTIYHLSQGTSDVGGAVFMAVLLGLLVWNPGFIQGKNQV